MTKPHPSRVKSGRVDRARMVALEILHAVEEKGAYANLVLDQVLRSESLDDRSRAFVTELVYGTIKMRGRLDYVLSKGASRSLDELTAWIRNILRLGLYQALYLRVPAAAAVNESVELAKRFGHAGTVGFVNGVLRGALRKYNTLEWPDKEEDPASYLSVYFSHPKWIVEMWLTDFGWDETVQLCQANNATAPTTIRTNTLRTTRDELAEVLSKSGITAASTALAPEGINISHYGSISRIPYFKAGWFQVQDESSMLVSHLVEPRPGERVLDMCAAPGGKSTHMAALMGNGGEILAVDLHRHKLDMLECSARRLGITCIRTWACDVRDLPKEHDGAYDAVLLDAPCSGLGVLRRKPDLRWRKEIAAVSALGQMQRELLDRAARLVKPGGRLVYSTCTLTQAENEENVRWFTGKYQNFAIKRPSNFLANLASSEGWVKLLPHVTNTDGFFMVQFVKQGMP